MSGSTTQMEYLEPHKETYMAGLADYKAGSGERTQEDVERQREQMLAEGVPESDIEMMSEGLRQLRSDELSNMGAMTGMQRAKNVQPIQYEKPDYIGKALGSIGQGLARSVTAHLMSGDQGR